MVSLRTSRLIVLFIIAALAAALVPASAYRAEAAGGGEISYGQTVTGQINNINYFEMWTFSGTKGDRVQITMTGDGFLDSYLGLIDGASEEVLAEDDDSAGNSNAVIEMTLPGSGNFIIVATRYDFDTGTSQGSYQLELAGGTGPQNPNPGIQPASNQQQPQMLEPGVYYMGDMVLAEPVPGTISADSYAQLYTVELEAGTEFMVAMFADGSMLDSYLIFGTEAGDVLAEDDDSGATVDGSQYDSFLSLQIPQSGVYYIVATRSGMDSGTSTGDYVLVAGVPEADSTSQQQDTDFPAGVVFMGDVMVGGTASGSLSAQEYAHLYSFNGNAGETVTITMKGQGGLDTYLGLLDPEDNVIAEDNSSGGGTDAQISIRLPETATYVIVATRDGLDTGSTVGNYSLALVAGPPPAPTGTTSIGGGFGGLPGRAFPVGESTFYLRGTGASTNPDKATPLEELLAPEDDGLPGRSLQIENESVHLSGFGASDDPAKSTPLEQLLGR